MPISQNTLLASAPPREPAWNFLLYLAAHEPEADLTRKIRLAAARPVARLAQENPERFAKLSEALSNPAPTAIEWIEALVAAGASADAVFDGLHTALAAAAHHGLADRVAALLPHSDPKRVSIDGWTALSCAAAEGHAECVRLLLPRSEPELASIDGWTPLSRAAFQGHAECVRFILPVLGDESLMSETLARGALHHAIHGDHAECLAALLERLGEFLKREDLRRVNAPTENFPLIGFSDFRVEWLSPPAARPSFKH